MTSPIAKAFTARTGQSIEAWLKENAHRYTLAEASDEIGYSEPKSLRWWVNKHMPGLEFKQVPRYSAITQAAKDAGIPVAVVRSRVGRGESLEQAISRPVQSCNRWKNQPPKNISTADTD